MNEKNLKLAKENRELRIALKGKIAEQEEMIKKTVKSKYLNNMPYKGLVEAVDDSIENIRNFLKYAISVKESLFKEMKIFVNLAFK